MHSKTAQYWNRIFGWLLNKQSIDRTATGYIDPAKVINAYGAVLEKKGSGIADIKDLPYPKEVIKAVLFDYIKKSKTQEEKEFFKSGCMFLSDFQPLSSSEKMALQKWSAALANTKIKPSDIDFESIASCGDEVIRLQQISLGEAQLILDELQHIK